MRLVLRQLQDDILDLRREHVHATDDKHVVATAEDTVHAHERTSARTFIIVQGRQVVGTVAEQRHTFLRQMGEGQFTEGTLRQWLTRIGIQDLRIEIVFTQVRAMLIFALIAHTGTGDLTQTIDIIGLDA